MDHLSTLDASFLHLETPETPMHVGSLLLVDLPPGRKGDYYEDFKAMIAGRLHLASILTRKLASMPFDLAEPVWIEDDDIDLDYHIRSLVLRRPGSMAQLEALVARLHSSLLDRSRPLWEMYVIEGLASGQVALYFKAHHSGVDGKSATEMMKVLYDTSPEVRQVPPPRRHRRQKNYGYQLGVAEMIQAALSNSARQYRALAELLPAAARAIGAAGNVVSRQRTKPGERPLALGMAPRTPFNVSITNQRSFASISLPFPELKALGKRVGGTVNTIVMAMCSSALARFLKERDELPREPLIAAVPVSLRTEGDGSMNNQVSMVRVDLATDIADMAERFKAIHASSEAAKAVVRELKPVLGADVPITGAPWLISSMASLYGRSTLARDLPPTANVTISNVPGPAHQLYICGGAMASFYPVSIPYHGAALNITVQSYAGRVLEFGITSCRRVLSQDEAHELAGYLKDALKEIERLPSVQAGAAPSAPVAAAPTKKAPAARKSGSRRKAAA
ncbi:WS/DGAT/MGAT family O-acyltransferase [Ottowia sp.]|uniref:WS/DGAT/MGAT family O-acyltransferase n=1 Tax=Ottowia sp. TaxID=1898956 RepID=UPI0039E2F912